jgi:hypothetical protein
MSSRESFLFEHFFLHISRENNNIYSILFLINYICIDLFIKILNLINYDCILNLYVSLIMTLVCLDPYQWSLMNLITGNKVKKTTQAKVLWKRKGQSQQKNFEKFISFDNNGLVKPSCGTVALYGPFVFFLRYGGLSMNNLGWSL